MKKLIFIPIVGILLQGCGTSYQFDPQIQKGQKEVYIEGVETVISKKKANVAVRSAGKTYSYENRPKLIISVSNKTNNPFNFSTNNIKVFVDGKAHKVYTYDELVDEAKTQEVWSSVAAGLAGTARSYNASSSGYSYNYNPYGTTNYSRSTYGYNTYPSSTYTYNYAAAQQARNVANSQTDSEMRHIRNQTEQSLEELKATMLKKTTIQPKSTYGGYVTFEDIQVKEKPHKVKVIVSAAGQEHMFVFNHFKVKQ